MPAAPLTAAAWLAFAAGAAPTTTFGTAVLAPDNALRGQLSSGDVSEGGAVPEGAPTKTPRNVVLIVVDALRPDHLGAYGYGRPTSPNIDRFAREGFVFENAITQGNWTLPALASIMTSLYPSVHGAVLGPGGGDPDWLRKMTRGRFFPKPGARLDESRLTWAEILRDRGYATAGFVGRSLCGAVFGFSQGFSEYPENERPLAARLRGITRWLHENRARPFFLYLHVMDVHDPFRTPERFSKRWDPEYRGPIDGDWGKMAAYVHGEKVLSPRDAVHLMALYDGAIASFDDSLGALLREFDASGVSGRTVVIVTADHGEEFGEHGTVRHGRSAYDTLLKVPLILRVPGRAAGRRIMDQVRSIDILPTALDLLGLPSPKVLQGRSLTPLLDGASLPDAVAYSEPNFFEASGLPAVVARTLEWKLIHRLDGKPDELYHIRSDPAERLDVAARFAAKADHMREEIADWRQRQRQAASALSAPKSGGAPLDEATIESLRRMGYLR